jgi:hypothetical protein
MIESIKIWNFWKVTPQISEVLLRLPPGMLSFLSVRSGQVVIELFRQVCQDLLLRVNGSAAKWLG